MHAGGVSTYEADKARGRKDDVLHAALNVGASDAMKFQLGVMAKKDGDTSVTGVRPAMTYSMGNVNFHAGYDSFDDERDNTKYTGFGVGAGLGLGGGNMNASIAKGTKDDNGMEHDITSAAVNYTMGPWGVGYIHSTEDAAGGDDPQVNTLYGAYTVPLFGIQDASMTFAASTSKAKNVATSDDTVNAVRLRFNYAF
ncbi:MAG: hypothetical protein R3E89_16870 [Thiolinea sp.]